VEDQAADHLINGIYGNLRRLARRQDLEWGYDRRGIPSHGAARRIPVVPPDGRLQ
jgi:hypothetical protein